MERYKLMVDIDGKLIPTSWPPRSLKSASALARYYERIFPQYTYWLEIVGLQLFTELCPLSGALFPLWSRGLKVSEPLCRVTTN